MDIDIPDDERPTGPVVSHGSDPARHLGGREHNPGFPTWASWCIWAWTPSS